MRFAAGMLAAALVATPVWAADTATTGSGDTSGTQTIQSAQIATSGDKVILLLPSSELDTFRQSLSSDLSNQIQILPTSDALNMEGRSYSMIVLPASQLTQLDQDLAGKPVHDDMKVVLSFGQFVNVADLSSFTQGNDMQAADTSQQSKEQTSASSTDASQASPSASTSSSGSSNLQAQGSTGASASQPFAFSGLNKDQALLVVPADQLQGIGSQISGNGQPFVVIPYDRFVQVIDPSKLSISVSPSREQTSASAASSDQSSAGTSQSFLLPGMDRNHVMLIVPADSLKNFSQISAPAGDAFVIVPLDQLNKVIDKKTTAAQSSSSAAMTSSPSTSQPAGPQAIAPQATITPSREQTSYSSGAMPPSYGDTSRLLTLQSAGEANSVLRVIPAAGGWLVYLRDGMVLTVPDSANLPANVTEGAWVTGQYEQQGGQNLVTSLMVVPHRDQGGGSGR